MTGRKDRAKIDPAAVNDLINAVALEGKHAADLLIDAFEKRALIPPANQRSKNAVKGLELGAALVAAAALRQQEWRSQGLDRYVECGLPEPAGDVDTLLTDSLGPSRPEKAAARKRLAIHTLLAWIRSFGWSARAQLDADIALGSSHALSDCDIEQLAGFLWANRECGRSLEGEKHASS